MINPYDLGNYNLVERTEKIRIDDFVREANRQLKLSLVKSLISNSQGEIELITSKTKYNGERLWFKCPQCSKRRGVLFKSDTTLGCRECLNLKYLKQRYKGMIETQY